MSLLTSSTWQNHHMKTGVVLKQISPARRCEELGKSSHLRLTERDVGLTISLLLLSEERILQANNRGFNSLFDYPVSLLPATISEVGSVLNILLLRGRKTSLLMQKRQPRCQLKPRCHTRCNEGPEGKLNPVLHSGEHVWDSVLCVTPRKEVSWLS